MNLARRVGVEVVHVSQPRDDDALGWRASERVDKRVLAAFSGNVALAYQVADGAVERAVHRARRAARRRYSLEQIHHHSGVLGLSDVASRCLDLHIVSPKRRNLNCRSLSDTLYATPALSAIIAPIKIRHQPGPIRIGTMPNPQTEYEKQLVERAHRVLPGGSLGNVNQDVVIVRGEGSRIWDASGNEYVDYLLGSGPMLIGHSHPEVIEAVKEQLDKGRHVLRHQRSRHRACRSHRGRRSVRRQGAFQLDRHRGYHVRHARGAGVPGQRQDSQVRGRIPRHERLRADERVRLRRDRVPARRVQFGGNPPRHTGPGAHCAVQRSRYHPRHHRAASRRVWAASSWSLSSD